MNERERVEAYMALERLESGPDGDDRGPMVVAAAAFLVVVFLALAGIAAAFVSAVDVATKGAGIP